MLRVVVMAAKTKITTTATTVTDHKLCNLTVQIPGLYFEFGRSPKNYSSKMFVAK